MHSLGERLEKLQKERGLKKKFIFEKVGIANVTYWHYEKGITQPTLENLIKLADFFNVSVDFLIGRTDNPEVNR
jgi:transcriptional regulator with XRE-family HTH domain